MKHTLAFLFSLSLALPGLPALASDDNPEDVATKEQIPLIIKTGDTLARKGKHEEALKEYKKGLKYFPDHYELLSRAGNCYIQLGEWFSSVKTFEAAFAKRKDAKARLIESYRGYGNELMADTNFGQAIRIYKRLLKLAPQDQEVRSRFIKPNVLRQDLRMQALLAAGNRMIGKKRYGVASGYLKRALELEPENVTALQLFGFANSRQRLWADAIPAYEKVYLKQQRAGPVKIARELKDWDVVGPFPFKGGLGRKSIYPVETETVHQVTKKYRTAGRTLAWRKVKGYAVRNLNQLLKAPNKIAYAGAGGIAYAYTDFTLPDAVMARLSIGSDDGVAVWLNGQSVWDNAVARPLSPGQDKVGVMLKKGKNTLLLKIDDSGLDWGFSVRIDPSFGASIEKELVAAYMGQGDDQFASKEYDAAISSYTRALRFGPGNVQAHLKIADALAMLEKFEEAVRHLAKSAKDDSPKNVPIFLKLGEIHLQAGDIGPAKAAYQRVLKLDAKSLDAIAGLGDCYMEDSEFAKAVAEYKKAGKLFLEQRKYAEAIEVYEDALVGAPDDVELVAGIGRAYHLRRALTSAIKQYELALEIDPKHMPTLEYAGDAYMAFNAEEKTRRALEAFEKAVALQPQNTPLRIKLAKAYIREKRFPKAMAELEAARKQSPGDARAHLSYAEAFVQSRRFAQALKFLQDVALAKRPGNAQLLHLLAQTYEGLDQPAEALATLRKALKIQPRGRLANEFRQEVRRLQPRIARQQAGTKEKLVVVVFGSGTRSSDTTTDPRHRHIPYLWNRLRPLGTLHTEVSLNGYSETGEVMSALLTGHWGQDLENAPIEVKGPVLFSKHIQPILSRRCNAANCHIGNAENAGGLALTSFQSLEAGSKNGDVIRPGDSSKSAIIKYLTGEVKPSMPPENPLPPAQIDLIRRWIDEGAKNLRPAARSAAEQATPEEPAWDGRPTFTTLFEHFRKQQALPDDAVWFVTSNSRLEKMCFSKDPQHGKEFKARSMPPEVISAALQRLQKLRLEWDKTDQPIQKKLAALGPKELGLGSIDSDAAKLITRILKETRSLYSRPPGQASSDASAPDRLTYLCALNILKAKKPSLLVVSFAQPDDSEGKSHAQRVREISQADSYTSFLWEALTSLPEYSHRTNFIVVLPHPRENRAEVLVIGPRVPAGLVETNEKRRANDPYALTDVIVQMADMLGFDYAVPQGDLKKL